MSVSIVDGRVESAEIKRQTKVVHQYSTLRLALDGGGEKTLANAVVANELAAKLQPGATGRFYLYSNLDLRGVYGFRDSAGVVTKAHPQNMKYLYYLVPLAWIGLVLFETFGEGTPVLYLIGLLLMTVAAIYGFITQRQADRAFEEDNRGQLAAPRRL